MNLIRIYLRTLGLLAPAARLAWTLAIANLLLAGAQFAEPVLFGRVIDTLSQANASGFSWSRLAGLLGAWAVFGLRSCAMRRRGLRRSISSIAIRTG